AKNRVDQWLLALQKWYPLTESCLIDKNGKEHARASQGVLSTVENYSTDEAENPFFFPSFQLEEGEVYTAYPYFTHDSNQWVFAYTSPVVLLDGSKPAFLHIEISASHFQDLVKFRKGSYFDRLTIDHGHPEVVGSDRFIIVDENGALVADSEEEVLFAEGKVTNGWDIRFSDVLPKSHTISADPDFQEAILRMRRGENGFGRFMRENRLHLISYHPLPFFGWSLAAIRPHKHLLESRWDMELIKQVLATTGGAILFLSALTVWWLVGRMVQPLRALTQAAQEVVAGKQDTRFPSCTRRDEIGQLAHSLNQMRQTILDYHHDLEEKISQRTEKFLGANMRLQETIEELEGTREELVHREKMASLGRLVAGFAHEINTPVGIAIGSLSVVPEGINHLRQMLNQEEVDGEVLDRLLDKLDEAAKLGLGNLSRAAEIVSRFKRTSVDQSMEADRLFNVKEAVEDVVLSLHNQFKKTRIWIDTVCPADINVYSQPGALGQVLTNLMMNSLIHGFDQGQQAGTIEIKISLSQDGSHVVIIYSDTGKGMSAEVVKKIFDPFFTTARDKGGSGLGMYICYNIVRTQLKGTIECGSHPGEGSVFQIEFPVGMLNPRKEEEVL
ncbi:MAG: sensor histidine kinase, partial [Magnetococcales bacterium]|nr:sensor histidine kinase [Magnetococcales bacterium]